jgi:hypothetical protein
MPLILSAMAILVFYKVDVSQLLADQGMRGWWGHLMADRGFSFIDFIYNLFNLFAMVGTGLFFWILFGILGSIAFLLTLSRLPAILKLPVLQKENGIRLYAVLLLLLVIALNLAKKLPVGEPRLNAFTIPSICILIISLFEWLSSKKGAWGVTAMVLPLLLFAGVIGNVYTSFITAITGPVYEKRMATYKATEHAVAQAQSQKLPILITPEVAFPYDTTQNLPFNNTVPGDWVIKTFPAFKINENTPVCAITDTAKLEECKAQLPQNIKAAMVGNGLYYRVVKW